MLDVAATSLVAIALAVLVGSLVQGVVGLGLGLVAAPVMTLVEPGLMPGTMLMLVSTYPLITLARERDDIDWRSIGWTFPTRLVGTAVGVGLVAVADDRQLGVAVGVMVLLAVLLSARTVRVPVNRGSLSAAGFVSGITGTTSSIGGPPFALLISHRPPRQLRTTLAVYFCLGSGMSLVGLSVTGQLGWQQVQVAALMVPVLLLGTALTGVLRRGLRPGVVRPLVLVVCGASALVLLVRSLA